MTAVGIVVVPLLLILRKVDCKKARLIVIHASHIHEYAACWRIYDILVVDSEGACLASANKARVSIVISRLRLNSNNAMWALLYFI